MGRARIVSGGTDGRYTIELDYGSETKTALLAKLSTALTEIDIRIAEIDALIVAADAEEAEQLAVVNAAFYEYSLTANDLPPGSPLPDSALLRFEMDKLSKLRAQHRPLRQRKESLNFQRATIISRISYWNSFEPVTVRQAWCVDLTEDAAADAIVATHEIPGEPSITVISAGARTWLDAGVDGRITAREIMSPEQAFFNAAILPGWQKWKPTYRWGVITSIDKDLDIADVSFEDTQSSAQSLSIDQASSLSGVPIDYMDCNAVAFDVGDRVVVQFQNQNWSDPKIIGFLDNPKSCTSYTINFYYQERGYCQDFSGTCAYYLLDTQKIFPDSEETDTTAVAAPADEQPLIFIGWTDGTTTRTYPVFTPTSSKTLTAIYYKPRRIDASVSHSWLYDEFQQVVWYFDGNGDPVYRWEVRGHYDRTTVFRYYTSLTAALDDVVDLDVVGEWEIASFPPGYGLPQASPPAYSIPDTFPTLSVSIDLVFSSLSKTVSSEYSTTSTTTSTAIYYATSAEVV